MRDPFMNATRLAPLPIRKTLEIWDFARLGNSLPCTKMSPIGRVLGVDENGRAL